MNLKSKLVITGAAGFIGAYWVRFLLESGRAQLEDLCLVDTPEAFEKRLAIKQTIGDFSKVIVFSPEEFEGSVLNNTLSFRPSTVFHFGASSSTEEMRLEFLKRWNVEYSKNIWTYCASHKIPLVYASSAATYGGGEMGFSDAPEKFSMLKPLNPYGESKLIFDIWAHAESKKGLAPPIWAGLRFFNVYGPGEEHKGNQASVVVHARKQILETGTLKLFESHRQGIAHGQQKRDFIFVEDLCRVSQFFVWGFPKYSGIFNVGTGEARTFEDLAKACFACLNVPVRISYIPTPEKLRPHYQYFTQADLNRLRGAGFHEAFTRLEEGVLKTLQNYYG